MGRARIIFASAGAALVTIFSMGVSVAQADDWLPHPAGARWQYKLTDSTYKTAGSVENVVVASQSGINFTLAWGDANNAPPTSTTGSYSCPTNADMGTMSFQDTTAGLVNTDWTACPAPSAYPANFLCAAGSTSCANSLSSALFNVIWGNRNPVLSEPLLQGTSWNSTGGQSGEVSSSSQYLGLQSVKVPAFPAGVMAAIVRTNLAIQQNTAGDQYGSGIRTTWWVNGVGPVRVAFDHVDGSVTNVDLLSTTLTPKATRSDINYFPLTLGLKGTYSYTNTQHLTHTEVERMSVDAVSGRSARISFTSVSGPMRVAGQYGFDEQLNGLTNIWGSTRAASLLKYPKLGHNRHFFTPFDLMTYGFNPVLSAYPQAGQTWHSGNARDMQVYGVTGTTKVIGVRSVHVPAGTFNALEVKSTLTQNGYPYGSGTRTMWFGAKHELVKLVFNHRDGSVSVVQLTK